MQVVDLVKLVVLTFSFVFCVRANWFGVGLLILTRTPPEGAT